MQYIVDIECLSPFKAALAIFFSYVELFSTMEKIVLAVAFVVTAIIIPIVTRRDTSTPVRRGKSKDVTLVMRDKVFINMNTDNHIYRGRNN